MSGLVWGVDGTCPLVMDSTVNCINCSVVGNSPYVTCHNFPSCSHEDGEVGSKLVGSKLSSPGLDCTVFETNGALELFEDVFAATNGNKVICSLFEGGDDTTARSLAVIDLVEFAGVESMWSGDCGRISRPNSSLSSERDTSEFPICRWGVDDGSDGLLGGLHVIISLILGCLLEGLFER